MTTALARDIKRDNARVPEPLDHNRLPLFQGYGASGANLKDMQSDSVLTQGLPSGHSKTAQDMNLKDQAVKIIN